MPEAPGQANPFQSLFSSPFMSPFSRQQDYSSWGQMPGGMGGPSSGSQPAPTGQQGMSGNSPPLQQTLGPMHDILSPMPVGGGQPGQPVGPMHETLGGQPPPMSAGQQPPNIAGFFNPPPPTAPPNFSNGPGMPPQTGMPAPGASIVPTSNRPDTSMQGVSSQQKPFAGLTGQLA